MTKAGCGVTRPGFFVGMASFAVSWENERTRKAAAFGDKQRCDVT